MRKRTIRGKMLDMFRAWWLRAGKVERHTVEDVATRADELHERFQGGALRGYLEEAELLVAMLRDYLRGAYKGAPYRVIGMTALVLGYVLLPLDAIADFLLPFGLLDDATMVGLLLAAIHADVQRYRAWREGVTDVPACETDGGDAGARAREEAPRLAHLP